MTRMINAIMKYKVSIVIPPPKIAAGMMLAEERRINFLSISFFSMRPESFLIALKRPLILKNFGQTPEIQCGLSQVLEILEKHPRLLMVALKQWQVPSSNQTSISPKEVL